MASLERDPQQRWQEYYALRKRARLSLLALLIVLALVVEPLLIWLIDRVSSQGAQLAILYGGGILVIIAFAVPVVKWAQWRCPRCGKRFAQSAAVPGNVFAIVPRLLFPWRCANCRLDCGADPGAAGPA